MGFLRKGLFVATGGASGVAGVKPNSKKERTAKALEQQNRMMKQQSRQPAPTVAQVTPPSNAHDFRMVNYDGGFTVHPTPRREGSLRLTDQRWELHFRGVTQFIQGPYARYSVVTKPNKLGGCLVTMTDRQDESIKWTFEIPGTPGERIEAHWQARQPKGAPALARAVRLQTSQVGIADEIAKLGQLREQGLLTDAEFNAQKLKLLGRP